MQKSKGGRLMNATALKRRSSTSVARQSQLDASRQELARARTMARAWASTIAEARRPQQAALFAKEALRAFAELTAPNLGLSDQFGQPYGKLAETSQQLARSIGVVAAALPLNEGCHYLTSLYTALLPQAQRSSLGAFYTPPALVERLLDLAAEGGTDWRTARVLDPACGGGAFLLKAADLMRDAMKGSEPSFVLSQLANRLVGFELDPHAASLAQNALEIACADLAAKSVRPVPIFIRACDTLEEPADASFDLVVGNPPYGRVALTSDQRQRYARSLYGHANLYGVFTDIALRWTKPGGLIAYLTPTSFLGGHYYTALRDLLGTEAPPSAIDFVQARKGVFEDVLQETLLALFKKDGRKRRFQVHYLTVESEREATVIRNGKVSLPQQLGQPWLAPREPQHVKLIAAAEEMPSRLADWGYEVSTGPLVWNRFKDQLRDRQSKDSHPLIWAEAVTATGQFRFRAEKRNHAPYFKVGSGDAWLVVNEACVLVQRTTAKEQPRRLIAAELPAKFVKQHGGVVVENHLNMVRATRDDAVAPAVVAAVLNSRVVDQLFRCISGSVAVSAFELEAVPLPSPKQLKRLAEILRAGGTSAAVEAELEKLYGVGHT